MKVLREGDFAKRESWNSEKVRRQATQLKVLQEKLEKLQEEKANFSKRRMGAFLNVIDRRKAR